MLTERAPDVAQGWRLLGATYLRMNAPDRALDVVRKPLARGAQDPMLFTIAGEAALKQGDSAGAAKYFEKARALDPKDARKLTGLALAHLASGDPKRAIGELESAVQLDSSNLQTELALVTALMRDKRYDQALAAIDRMDKKEPGNPLPANLRGAVLNEQGKTQEARRAFEEAVKRDPKYFPAAANLANLDLHENKPAEARKRYEAVLAADPKNAQAHVALAALAARTGAPRAEVLALLEKGRAANPQSALPVLATGRYMLETNTPGEAVPLLQQAVNKDPDNPQLLDLLASALLRTDQRVQAIATWERLLRASPSNWGAHMHIGEAQRAAGNNEAALASFRKAAAIAQDAVEPQVAIASVLQQLGRKDEAQKVATELSKSDRNGLVGLVLQGDLAAADRNWAPAIDAYRKAFAQQKSLPVGTKLHRALLAAGRTADADTMLRDWIRSEPKDLPLRLYAGESELARQRWRQAYDQYAVVIDKEPSNALALNNAAWALHQLKDDRAPEIAKRAWEAAPKNPAILDTYGVILSERGDAKGLDMLRQAVAAAPEAAQLRLHLAEALARAGDKAAAREAVAAVLETTSTGPIAEAARALQAKL
ncbi:MAG: XrtA/PEP-CTERM system TPR-repeat protein PrsT [Gammaproteobacteria bacterium]